MNLTIIGCSDAFGSGGRHHSCYMLDTSHGRLLIDCGANAPLALKRAGIEPSSIDAILISHCHGDHYAGLPFLFLDRLFMDKSGKPFELLGPEGLQARTEALIESCYPSLIHAPRPFDLRYREIHADSVQRWRGLTIRAYEMSHYSGSPSLALSIRADGRRFSYSGDTGWCAAVAEAGRDADLYLIECTMFSTKTDMHLDYVTLATKFAEIGAKRYILTHMSAEMLAARAEIDPRLCTLAEDGLSIAV